MNTSGKLVVMRHTESNDNAKGIWSGIHDTSLTKKGRKDAEKFGYIMRDINFDIIYVSQLKRTIQTLNSFLKLYGDTSAVIKKTGAIDERDYGKLTGKDKWQARAEMGMLLWNDVRRGWDTPIPDGETLRDVYERVVPWYREIVAPQLLAGRNILIVIHGNSGRALRKYLERINDVAIRQIEMNLDVIRIYEIDKYGYATKSSIRKIKTSKTHRY